MKIKTGTALEYTIYGEDENKKFLFGINFPKRPTKAKIKELQRILQTALADFNL